MCNCKGYDIAYWLEDKEVYTVEPHFCRVLDDCGHADNTLEEAADRVATSYDELYKRYMVMAAQARESWYAWKTRTHPDYLHYTTEEDK